MDVTLLTYVPFQHENYAYIISVLEIARKQDITKLEGLLTSTLIYINAVDYIAYHLLKNLILIDVLITNNELNGIVFRNQEGSKGKPLQRLIEELQRYEFPMKNSFLNDLNDFKNMRNTVAHDLLALKQEQLPKADKDLFQIRITGEKLLDQYDTIVRGIKANWRIYVEKIYPSKSTVLQTQNVYPEPNEQKQ